MLSACSLSIPAEVVVEFEQQQYFVSEEKGVLRVCVVVRLTSANTQSCPVAYDFRVLVEGLSQTASEFVSSTSTWRELIQWSSVSSSIWSRLPVYLARAAYSCLLER